jgi:hypothetical protein
MTKKSNNNLILGALFIIISMAQSHRLYELMSSEKEKKHPKNGLTLYSKNTNIPHSKSLSHIYTICNINHSNFKYHLKKGTITNIQLASKRINKTLISNTFYKFNTNAKKLRLKIIVSGSIKIKINAEMDPTKPAIFAHRRSKNAHRCTPAHTPFETCIRLSGFRAMYFCVRFLNGGAQKWQVLLDPFQHLFLFLCYRLLLFLIVIFLHWC